MATHDFRKADHLPNLRHDGIPPPPERLPRQRCGTTPQMHGRYPDYDVLAHAEHWDEVTRGVVVSRAQTVPAISFFAAEEARTLRAFCDLVLAQDAEPRIPVLEMVDAKLAAGDLDGFRHHDMPEDPETWRLVAAGLDEAAGGSFADLEGEEASRVVARFADGELSGGVWERIPCSKAWSVVMRGTLSAFYSHPWAWNEIGYGGPAYPRGYMRLGVGQREPHQGREVDAEDPVQEVQRAGLG
ncbi:MAG TPA: gluconate 2-dehydrogenase subunit 3 family protein [Solirubrobacteraceae bacterium]